MKKPVGTKIAANLQLNAILNSFDDAIIVNDLQGLVVDWNSSAEKLFGYSSKEMVGHHISMLSPPDRIDEAQTLIDAISRGERIDRFETKRKHKSGCMLDVSLTICPIVDKENRIVGISKIVKDVTENNKVKRQLETLTKELDHRVKNLLAIVMAMVRLTKSDNVSAYKNIIEQRIASLASVHSQVAASNWRGVDVRLMIEDQIKSYQPHQFVISGEEVKINPTAAQALAIVLHELCTNTVKFGSLSREEGRVYINWFMDQTNLTIIWEEKNGPKINIEPKFLNFGMTMIQKSLFSLVGAQTSIKWNEEGLDVHLNVPIDHVKI